MRQVLFLLFVLLAGCAASTADVADGRDGAGRSAVKRYAGFEQGADGNACPAGNRLVCVSRAGGDTCGCISNAEFRDRTRRSRNPWQ